MGRRDFEERRDFEGCRDFDTLVDEMFDIDRGWLKIRWGETYRVVKMNRYLLMCLRHQILEAKGVQKCK